MELIVKSLINTPRYKVDIVSQGEHVKLKENGVQTEGPYRPDRFIIRQWQPGVGLRNGAEIITSADASLNADAVNSLRSACEEWLSTYHTFQRFKGEDATRRLENTGGLSGTGNRSTSQFGRSTGDNAEEMPFSERVRSQRSVAA